MIVDGAGPGRNQKTGSYEYGIDYVFWDVTENGSVCTLKNENVYIVDLGNGTNDHLAPPTHSFECYENLEREVNGAYSPLNDAHDFGSVMFGMYQDWLAQALLADQLAMKVHHGNGYDNAYRDGQSMVSVMVQLSSILW